MLITQSCRTLQPMNCSPPGSSVCGILQARLLQWVAILCSGDLPNPGIKPQSPALHRNSHCKLLCCHKEDCSKTGGTKSHVQIFYYLICTILSLKYFIANFDVETKQNEWTLWNKWHWQNSFLPCEYKKKKRY